jgi:hypothetical protein
LPGSLDEPKRAGITPITGSTAMVYFLSGEFASSDAH